MAQHGVDGKPSKSRRLDKMESNGTQLHRLRALGFCGADDSCHPELLYALSSRYGYIEWGVLFRDELEGTPRFASQAWLDHLGDVNHDRTMQLAGHLCSKRCEEVLCGDPSFVSGLHSKYGFKRFQVNATSANHVNMSLVNSSSAAKLREVMVALPHLEFIIQRNTETEPLWRTLESGELGPLPSNVSFLFDESKGTGVVAAEWPSPPPGPFGYAGGLGPKTLEAQLRRMVIKISEQHAAASSEVGREFWVDMESSLRTTVVEAEGVTKDIFDVTKCMACVLLIEGAKEDGILSNST